MVPMVPGSPITRPSTRAILSLLSRLGVPPLLAALWVGGGDVSGEMVVDGVEVSDASVGEGGGVLCVGVDEVEGVAL